MGERSVSAGQRRSPESSENAVRRSGCAAALRWIPAALLDDGCGPAGQVDGPKVVVAAVEDAIDQVTLGEVRVTGGGGDVDQVEPSRLVVRGGAVGRFGCEPGEVEVARLSVRAS